MLLSHFLSLFFFFKPLCLSVIDMLKAVDFNVYNLMSLGVSIHPWSHQHYQGHRHMHHLPNFLLPLLLSLLFSRLYLTLVTPWSLPGSSLHEISQPRMLEWVAISFSRLSNWSRDWTWLFLYYYFFFFFGLVNKKQKHKISPLSKIQVVNTVLIAKDTMLRVVDFQNLLVLCKWNFVALTITSNFSLAHPRQPPF